MNGQPKHGSIARRRATTAAVCTALVTGAVLLAAPAHAGTLDAPADCATGAPTTLVDVGRSSTGLSVGLLDCAAGLSTGDPAPTPSAPSASGTPTAPVSTPTTGSSTGATPDPATTESASGTGSSVTAASAASSATLATLSVIRSSETVYPVKDGFDDSVRFAVRAMNESGAFVPVVGSAVLTKGARTIDTWHIAGETKVITWNGRVGHAVEAGLYTLTVTAWSPDGTRLTERTMVRVRTGHLVRHAMVVRTDVGAKSTTADMPHALLKAYSIGAVTVRVRTVASVHGPAELVFSNGGVVRDVVLRNGVHTTRALAVPQGFSRVTISHDWAKGAAHLKSLKAIWTYSTLS